MIKERKDYTLEDFTLESVLKEETGRGQTRIFVNKKVWDINYSDILTFLIQKAGTICKHYASDLFISWSSLVKELEEKGAEYDGGKYLFGFREYGVDNDEYILSRLNNYGVEELKRNVKELYMLEVSIKREESVYVGDKIVMQLGKIDMDGLYFFEEKTTNWLIKAKDSYAEQIKSAKVKGDKEQAQLLSDTYWKICFELDDRNKK